MPDTRPLGAGARYMQVPGPKLARGSVRKPHNFTYLQHHGCGARCTHATGSVVPHPSECQAEA
jgi:hypothetical protein